MKELYIEKLMTMELKKRFKNILTIIIPRHINRINDIADDLINSSLSFQLHSKSKKLNKNTDVYLSLIHI